MKKVTAAILFHEGKILIAKRKDIRLDPSNGICLCALHDKAFDKGFISITDEYKIIISEKVKTDNVLIDILSHLKV